ncbi:hypothetical protein [Serratia liquefaciens]|uniref:hypothetical protein n=1 Tax=Serratia liquefaciens TaxID=614 RepID=UPI00061B6566|nr:hypothetical protein [Serratia liquefaciens]AKE09190.1 hypothetical protein XJ20_04525 [Serratia liquefaciens]
MDKPNEESRKHFEEWIVSTLQTTPILDRCRNNPFRYVSLNTQHRWEAWRASRASIMVDTPLLCGDGENDTEYTEGYNDGISATEKTIRSIGLSIKGE